ncbi:MAG TPA: sugar transferase [Opitutaceae bacterium]|nr:sugar transferase [Opitutaceae bacterium]
MIDQVLTATKPALLRAEPKLRSRRASTPILLTAMIGDTLVLFVAMVLSSWLRFGTSLARVGVGAAAIHWTDYLFRAAFGTLLFVLLLPHRKVYDLQGILRLRQALPAILKAALTWLLAFMALSYLLRTGREISRVYVLVAFAVTTLGFLLWRTLLSRVAGSEAVVHRLRERILFVGWSSQATSLARALAADRRNPYEVVGYVPAHGEDRGSESGGLARRLGNAADLAELLQQRAIDLVIQAELSPSTEDTVRLASLCEKEMVDFKVIPNCFEILLSCLQLQSVSGIPVLGVSHLPLDYPLNIMLKRAVDLLGGLVGLLLSAPVIAAFGLMVYGEDPGPIIYRQRRLGRDGTTFWIYKIRSMKLDAEKDGKVGWTVKNDPRRLRVGAFMRRWNVDELPQFWNVLRGEMSLVGPRPERPELIKVFKEEISHYNARHQIKPGLTGWAQVNGFRGDTDLNGRVRCDLYYMENWSVLLDCQIMLMTFCKRSNAC